MNLHSEPTILIKGAYHKHLPLVQLPIHVKVLYFAQVADAVGSRQELYSFPKSASLAQLLSRVSSAHSSIQKVRPMMKMAVNGDIAGPSRMLSNGDTVAFFSPITGG